MCWCCSQLTQMQKVLFVELIMFTKLLIVLFSGESQQLKGKKAPPLPTLWLRSLLKHCLYQWMRKVSFCKLVIQQTFETKPSIHFNIHLICFHIDDKYYPPRTFLSRLFPLVKFLLLPEDGVFGKERSSFRGIDVGCPVFSLSHFRVPSGGFQFRSQPGWSPIRWRCNCKQLRKL